VIVVAFVVDNTRDVIYLLHFILSWKRWWSTGFTWTCYVSYIPKRFFLRLVPLWPCLLWRGEGVGREVVAQFA